MIQIACSHIVRRMNMRNQELSKTSCASSSQVGCEGIKLRQLIKSKFFSLLLLRFSFWTLSGCHRVGFGNTHERKQYPESCKLIYIKVDSPLHACISSEPWKIASPLLMKPGEAETFTTGRY